MLIPVRFLGLALIAFYSFSSASTIGVMPFANNSLSDKESVQPLAKGLADMLSTGLAKVHSLKIVERAQMDKVMRELSLSMSGAVEETSVKEAGKLLGADMLLLGSFNKGFGGEIRIDVRIVKVETGETIKAEEVTGDLKKIFKLIKKLNFKLADHLESSLSGEEKKSLESSDNDNLEAFLAFSQGLDAEDAGDFKTAKSCYEKALSLNSGYQRARQQLNALQVRIR